MTRKSLDRQLDGIINDVCTAHGFKPETEAKGGEIEAANALVYNAIRTLRTMILAKAGVPEVKNEIVAGRTSEAA